MDRRTALAITKLANDYAQVMVDRVPDKQSLVFGLYWSLATLYIAFNDVKHDVKDCKIEEVLNWAKDISRTTKATVVKVKIKEA